MSVHRSQIHLASTLRIHQLSGILFRKFVRRTESDQKYNVQTFKFKNGPKFNLRVFSIILILSIKVFQVNCFQSYISNDDKITSSSHEQHVFTELLETHICSWK